MKLSNLDNEVFLEMAENDQITISRNNRKWLVKWKTAKEGYSDNILYNAMGMFLNDNTKFNFK